VVIDLLAMQAWNSPCDLSDYRVGGVRLPSVLSRSLDDWKVGTQFAMVGQFARCVGSAQNCPGFDDHDMAAIAMTLLERAGGNRDAKIIDHLD
jgi:hypothetical protein